MRVGFEGEETIDVEGCSEYPNGFDACISVRVPIVAAVANGSHS